MTPAKVTASGPVRPTSNAHAIYHPVISARITGGFWAARQLVNATVSIPLGWERLQAAGNLFDLRLAACAAAGDYRNDTPFMDTDVYKWLEAVSWLAEGGPGGPQLARHADEATALLAAAQEDDGYLNSYFQVTQPRKRFTDLGWGHELYSAGHLIQAAVARLRAAGDPQVVCDLVDRLSRRELVGCIQPQPLTPLLLGGRVPATLRIPHALVIRQRPVEVTT